MTSHKGNHALLVGSDKCMILNSLFQLDIFFPMLSNLMLNYYIDLEKFKQANKTRQKDTQHHAYKST